MGSSRPTSRLDPSRRISSRLTVYYKRVFPVAWFGLLLIFVAVAVLSGAVGANLGGAVPFVIGPAAMMLFGYLLMKKLVFDLVDEVLDAGDALVIRNGHEEDRVPLGEIINVNCSEFTSPPRVTLALRTPSRFGDRISFCAPVRLMPFSTSPVIDALIARIDAARRAR